LLQSFFLYRFIRGIIDRIGQGPDDNTQCYEIVSYNQPSTGMGRIRGVPFRCWPLLFSSPSIQLLLNYYFGQEKGCVIFGNDDVAKESERKKGFFFFFYLTKRNGSTSISTPTFSSGNSDSGLHRIRQQYKHRTDVPTSEKQ